MLQSLGLQRVGYDLVTEQQITTVLRLRNPALNRYFRSHFAFGVCWAVHPSMPSLKIGEIAFTTSAEKFSDKYIG